MKTYLTQFENIGGKYANILRKKMKIRTIDDFLSHSLKKINENTDIDLDRLEEWEEVFDLYRIPNLSPREAELLRYANINTVHELAHRQTIRIFYKLQEIDEKSYYIILQLPSFSEINLWVYYAKLMVKKIKNGENIPIILLPMVNFESATLLKKYNIFSIEDFLHKGHLIKNLRKRVKINRKNYRKMIDLIEFIKVDGVDLSLAEIFLKNDMVNPKKFLNQSNSQIMSKFNEFQQIEKQEVSGLSEELINKIRNQISQTKERKE